LHCPRETSGIVLVEEQLNVVPEREAALFTHDQANLAILRNDNADRLSVGSAIAKDGRMTHTEPRGIDRLRGRSAPSKVGSVVNGTDVSVGLDFYPEADDAQKRR